MSSVLSRLERMQRAGLALGGRGSGRAAANAAAMPRGRQRAVQTSARGASRRQRLVMKKPSSTHDGPSAGMHDLSKEELLELAQQSHGSRGKTARRRLNELGIQVVKPKTRQSERASKQVGKERQGWNIAQMRKAKVRCCVNCKRLAPRDNLLRIVRTGTGHADMELVHPRTKKLLAPVSLNKSPECTDGLVNEEPLLSPGTISGSQALPGRSAYICRDKECIRTACKKQRLVRALKMSPRAKATRDRSDELMEAMLAIVAKETGEGVPADGVSEKYNIGPPEAYAHIQYVKKQAFDDPDMASYRLAGDFLESLTLEVGKELNIDRT